MANRKDLAAIQTHLNNPLDIEAFRSGKIAGVIGDHPSAYSKSPALWNAAFRSLHIDAIYLAFDVEESNLQKLVGALRRSPQFLGANVTVPFKIKIIDYLDQIDDSAGRIGAVNTIVRTPEGRLIGYNTDGEGFVSSILTPQPGEQRPFIATLRGLDVLLLGAGGSARAVAFHVADFVEDGKVIICNRTIEHAESIAQEIRATGHDAETIGESEISTCAPTVGLIINSTTKGQGGIRKQSNGKIINLEPYSSLAPAHPPELPESEYTKPRSQQEWSADARRDIETNNELSLKVVRSIPQSVRFYDLIYYPEETVLLRQARETGHSTRNGKGMIIHQAAIALFRHVCATDLENLGKHDPQTYQNLVEIMYAAW